MCGGFIKKVLDPAGLFSSDSNSSSSATSTTATQPAGSVADAQAAQAANAQAAAQKKRRAASSLLATGNASGDTSMANTSSVLAQAKSSLGQ